MGDFRMAAEPQITFGERMIAPVTNISDFIWGGTWDGEAVIPFPPLALILLGVGLWFMIGLRFYPIVKLGSAIMFWSPETTTEPCVPGSSTSGLFS